MRRNNKWSWSSSPNPEGRINRKPEGRINRKPEGRILTIRPKIFFGMAAMPLLSRDVDYFSYNRKVSWVVYLCANTG